MYRLSCADLLTARDAWLEASVWEHLDALVARAYAQVYGRKADFSGVLRSSLGFFWQRFPSLVRTEMRLVALSAALVFLGACFGAWVVFSDESALAVVVPDMHLNQTPTERVIGERLGGSQDVGRSTVFSSYLLTHNIQVTFLVFALGLTFGFGSAALLFWNGIPLGALAAQYYQSGESLFFWAWILPHGVVELTVVFIAGAAGFVLARGLWFPGLESRQTALLRESKRAVQLVVGGMPMLVLAGAIEGSLSQLHAPLISYEIKLVFALVLFGFVVAYLSRPTLSPTPFAGGQAPTKG